MPDKDIAYLLRRLEAAEAIVQYVLDTLPPVDQELFDAWQRSKEEVCLALRQLEEKP